MYEGAIVNGLIILVGALACAFVSAKVYREKTEKKEAPVISFFFMFVSIYLGLVGIRQFFAYAGRFDIDAMLFFALAPFFSFSAVPLMYMAIYILSGSKKIAVVVSTMVAAAAVVGLAFLYIKGITPIPMTEWGSDYEINSIVTRMLVLFVYLLCGIFSSIVFLWSGRKCDDPHVRYRLIMVGSSCLIFFIVSTVDAFGEEGVAMMGIRAITAVSALIMYMAYFPTKSMTAHYEKWFAGKVKAQER
jgi:hypothetical protein